jgi:hypothetical protein
MSSYINTHRRANKSLEPTAEKLSVSFQGYLRRLNLVVVRPALFPPQSSSCHPIVSDSPTRAGHPILPPPDPAWPHPASGRSVRSHPPPPERSRPPLVVLCCLSSRCGRLFSPICDRANRRSHRSRKAATGTCKRMVEARSWAGKVVEDEKGLRFPVPHNNPVANRPDPASR